MNETRGKRDLHEWHVLVQEEPDSVDGECKVAGLVADFAVDVCLVDAVACVHLFRLVSLCSRRRKKDIPEQLCWFQEYYPFSVVSIQYSML